MRLKKFVRTASCALMTLVWLVGCFATGVTKWEIPLTGNAFRTVPGHSDEGLGVDGLNLGKKRRNVVSIFLLRSTILVAVVARRTRAKKKIIYTGSYIIRNKV